MKEELIEIQRHSMSHVLAKALCKLYEGVKLTIGPAVDNGFYYDIDAKRQLNEQDMDAVVAEMKKIINNDEVFTKKVVSKTEALKLFKDNVYKTELINELDKNEEISLYYLNDDFFDLCRGPHVENTKHLKGVGYKFNRISGAYWRGSEKNKMLQRIYFYAFANNAELKEYLHKMEEAQKRDHRKLGKELGLYFFSDFAPGMPFYMPKGIILKNELIAYWRKMHQEAGYLEIETPIALNKSLWDVSGHWTNYKQNMYTFSAEENEEYAIKPMNCPGGMLHYKENIHSYKDLPIRVGELGKVHRREASGTLHGLFRVRAFTQDDAHIYLLPSQIVDEVKGIIDLVDKMYKVFNLSYHLELSTMPENHIGDKADWEMAEKALENALKLLGHKYIINAGDGAFYGPKIDIHIKDAIGRTWQCGTIQLDMQMPKRFNLEYVDADGTRKEPVMLHRVIYGSLDRFIGIITEHFAGAFPLWLSPLQVKILTISDAQHGYAKDVLEKLKLQNIRAELDERSETIGKKLREAITQKTPYLIIVGDEETKNNSISVRKRGTSETIKYALNDFIALLQSEIQTKKID